MNDKEFHSYSKRLYARMWWKGTKEKQAEIKEMFKRWDEEDMVETAEWNLMKEKDGSNK